jgi:hypothetical protein
MWRNDFKSDALNHSATRPKDGNILSHEDAFQQTKFIPGEPGKGEIAVMGEFLTELRNERKGFFSALFPNEVWEREEPVLLWSC